MPTRFVKDLFVHKFAHADNAEKQGTRSLPKLTRAALDRASAGLRKTCAGKAAFTGALGAGWRTVRVKPTHIKYNAMESVVGEMMSLVDQIEKGPVLNAALNGVAQTVEDHEIAGHRSLGLEAQGPGFADAMPLPEASLAQEQTTDRRSDLLAQATQVEEAAV